MSHTYTSTLFHVVFSTKERRRAIAEPPKLWAYVAGVARNLHYDARAVGGTENHVHILLRLPGQVAVAEAVQKLKSNSSRWLRQNGTWTGWQKGYGAFSVSASNVDAVRLYIQNQPGHHRRHSYEDELLALLTKSGVAFNRAEVFDWVPSLRDSCIFFHTDPALTCWATIVTPFGLSTARLVTTLVRRRYAVWNFSWLYPGLAS